MGTPAAACTHSSGLLAWLLISLAGVGSVLVVCAALAVLAILLAAGLRVPSALARDGSPEMPADGLSAGPAGAGACLLGWASAE